MNKETEAKLIKIAEHAVFEAMVAAADVEPEKPKAEKPKLRHGVCAIAKHNGKDIGTPFVVIEQSSLAGSPKAFYGDQGGMCEADERIDDYTILIPDIFDDLEALGKPPANVFLEAKANGYVVRVERSANSQAIIFLSAGATNGAHLNLDEAIEVRNALSQRIMEAFEAIESAGGKG